jgi:hypothetical protein
MDDQRLNTWGTLLESEVAALAGRDESKRYGRMVTRIRGVVV